MRTTAAAVRTLRRRRTRERPPGQGARADGRVGRRADAPRRPGLPDKHQHGRAPGAGGRRALPGGDGRGRGDRMTALSPSTGWAREQWAELADGMLAAVRPYASDAVSYTPLTLPTIYSV